MSVGEVLTRIDEQEKERFLDLQRSIKVCPRSRRPREVLMWYTVL